MPSTARTVVSEHRELLHLSELLVREYQPDIPAGAVIATVVRCRDALARTGVRAGLTIATESMARRRLAGVENPRTGEDGGSVVGREG